MQTSLKLGETYRASQKSLNLLKLRTRSRKSQRTLRNQPRNSAGIFFNCRLFKENPNLEGDALKVKNDRADLVI